MDNFKISKSQLIFSYLIITAFLICTFYISIWIGLIAWIITIPGIITLFNEYSNYQNDSDAHKENF